MHPNSRKASTYVGALFFAFLCLASPLFADSATWLAIPANGDWNTAANWTGSTVPNAPADTATFGTSVVTGISFSANTEIDGIVFNAGASAYTLTTSPNFILTISGTGITNNSGITQRFMVEGDLGMIQFMNVATAGSNTAFISNGGTVGGAQGGATVFFANSTAGQGSFTSNGGAVSGAHRGFTQFNDNSSGANGTFNNNGGAVSGAEGGLTVFFDTARAGNGTFHNNGGVVDGGQAGFTQFADSSDAENASFNNNGGAVSGAFGGATDFFANSTAGNGTFHNNASSFTGAGGGRTTFSGSATAGNGTFHNNGGTVSGAGAGNTIFFENSTAGNGTFTAASGTNGGAGGLIAFIGESSGGTARIEVFGNGSLDISLHNASGVTVGSIAGDGDVFLGSNRLTVGSNNLSTGFSGAIKDGGFTGGTGGSLTKIGTGTLILTGINTYTGGTTIREGSLQLQGSSATFGTGNVTLASGVITLEITTGVLNAVHDAATLSLCGGGVLNLADAGHATLGDGVNEILGGLILGGVAQGAGTYGSSSSGANFQSDEFFFGNGMVTVIPEPATWALLIVAAGFVFSWYCRRLASGSSR